MKKIRSFVVSAIVFGCSIGIGANHIIPLEQGANQNLSPVIVTLDLPDQH
ncbi:hypothetical protein [Cytobacillus sp.]|nr:hypothetical protein [Cytobacillus sp.]